VYSALKFTISDTQQIEAKAISEVKGGTPIQARLVAQMDENWRNRTTAGVAAEQRALTAPKASKETEGMSGVSKSQVSRLCEEIDGR
jgi:hypothetical protein